MGGLLYISDCHYYKFAAGIGLATNNNAELFVVMMVLKFAIYLGINKLQVFGDLLLVIYWLSHKRPQRISFLGLFMMTSIGS